VTTTPTGMLLTSYTYDQLNHLTQVAMPRNTANNMKTQTRTFVYDPTTQRLTSATNPENGTVSYTYNADGTLASKKDANHVPIIAPHPRRGKKKPSQLPKVFPAEPTPQLSWAQQDRFKERTMIERVNARLKHEFGASHVRVRGAVQLMANLMFGVLALTVDQWLQLGQSG
jgi:YD repeat-containing protein